MPVRRFWMMERQIDRIRGESDLRRINVETGIHGKDGPKDVIDRLKQEVGERYEIRRPKIVKTDPREKERLRQLARQQHG